MPKPENPERPHKKPKKEDLSKLRREIAQSLRIAYREYVQALKKYLQVAKQKKYAASQKWVSQLELANYGTEIARYCIRMLEKEHDHHKLFFELNQKHPDLLKIPPLVMGRVLEAAIDMSTIQEYLTQSLRDYKRYKMVWIREGARILGRVKGNPRYSKLKAEVWGLRKKAGEIEEQFDDFARAIFGDSSISLNRKIMAIESAEQKVVEAKILQEEKEIELAQFYRAIAIRANSPASYVEELARQIHFHRELWRLFQKKKWPKK